MLKHVFRKHVLASLDIGDKLYDEIVRLQLTGVIKITIVIVECTSSAATWMQEINVQGDVIEIGRPTDISNYDKEILRRGTTIRIGDGNKRDAQIFFERFNHPLGSEYYQTLRVFIRAFASGE